MTGRDDKSGSQYRKKPVVIEAMLYTGPNIDAVMEWCGATKLAQTRHLGFTGFCIPTLEDGDGEGQHIALAGDWIIKGVKGEFYPCKPEIFDMTYEPASASRSARGLPYVDRGDAVNLARNRMEDNCPLTEKGIDVLADAVLRMDEVLRAAPSHVESSSWVCACGATDPKKCPVDEARCVGGRNTPRPSTAHTDHPLRHFDRTCPACVAESEDTPRMMAAWAEYTKSLGQPSKILMDAGCHIERDLRVEEHRHFTAHERAEKAERELASAKRDADHFFQLSGKYLEQLSATQDARNVWQRQYEEADNERLRLVRELGSLSSVNEGTTFSNVGKNMTVKDWGELEAPSSKTASDDEDVTWLRWQAEMYMAGDDKFSYRLQHIADRLAAPSATAFKLPVWVGDVLSHEADGWDKQGDHATANAIRACIPALNLAVTDGGVDR